MLKLPGEGSSPATSHQAMPLGVSPNLAAAKKNAAHNTNAPKGGTPLPGSGKGNHFGFQGMADSAAICPPFGCQPPDMALATSPQYVFQGVNTSFELWTTTGKVVAGPVNAQRFFGVPNPSPSGCDPTGPFLSDPRAFYDPNTGYFWAAILQIENAGGVSPNCNFLSKYWIANFNPGSGTGCVYSFDMALNLYQSGYLFFAGDRDASFGAEMQDKNGNVFMVFDTMSQSLNPSIMYVWRAKSDPLGTIDHATFILKGPSATFNTRSGDYEAASYTGFTSNQVWVASQYSVSGDWNTFIARVS